MPDEPNPLNLAIELRRRLAEHAAQHSAAEHDALEHVEMVDQIIRLLQPKPSPLPRLSLVFPVKGGGVTQPFGVNHDYYIQFGLPGHEGLDIHAPEGTEVFACADGVVTQVGWRKRGHPYGYAIRMRHKCVDGEYETIFAHLQEGSAKVAVGDDVVAGQAIGIADGTGNVYPRDKRGYHLHLSLKKIGAKNGGYGELIDPTPYFEQLPPRWRG